MCSFESSSSAFWIQQVKAGCYSTRKLQVTLIRPILQHRCKELTGEEKVLRDSTTFLQKIQRIVHKTKAHQSIMSAQPFIHQDPQNKGVSRGISSKPNETVLPHSSSSRPNIIPGLCSSKDPHFLPFPKAGIKSRVELWKRKTLKKVKNRFRKMPNTINNKISQFHSSRKPCVADKRVRDP